MTEQEKNLLIESIHKRVERANQNNLTRTSAYLDFYLEHPEVEWALLAHLVSRNGGWQMTDLRGEWIPQLLTEKEAGSFFQLLERCNWLIFQDAYPQLLVYAHMKNHEHPDFSLLTQMGVSQFMIPIWQAFLGQKRSALSVWSKVSIQVLTWALIINEQNYIEQRVVQNPYYIDHVLSHLDFTLPALFSLTQIFFPFTENGETNLKLIGTRVTHFDQLALRINVGKLLYQLLFEDHERYWYILQFCTNVPHTGSRADFFPSRFTNHAPSSGPSSNSKSTKKLYVSPSLPDAWPDTVQPPAKGHDWFDDPAWYNLLTSPEDYLPILSETDYEQAIHIISASSHFLSPMISFFQRE